MRADPRFANRPNAFWATVRTVGDAIGYSVRGIGLKTPTEIDVRGVFTSRGLAPGFFLDAEDSLTEEGQLLLDYFAYRTDALTRHFEPHLMDASSASSMFERLRAQHDPHCPLPLNKQKGLMKDYAFLTCSVNILVESAIGAGVPCDYDPRALVTVTHNGALEFTMSRRVDGAFPSTRSPIAIWENKEYYYTTTFGSRVADGVFETQLDGYELTEARRIAPHDIEHVLFVDAHFTWWEKGKSYLCRIVDMLNMGLVDEVVVGSEIEEAVPRLARAWLDRYRLQNPAPPAP